MAYPLVTALVVLPTASERVSDGTHGLGQVGHLGDAAGVVRDGPYESMATTIPVMLSSAVAAMPMPYRPPSAAEARIRSR